MSNYPSGYNEPESLDHYLSRLDKGDFMSDDRIVARNLISYGNATMNLTAQTGGTIIYRLLAERDALQAKLTALETRWNKAIELHDLNEPYMFGDY